MRKNIFGGILALGTFALMLNSCQKNDQEGSQVKATSNNNQVIPAKNELANKITKNNPVDVCSDTLCANFKPDFGSVLVT